MPRKKKVAEQPKIPTCALCSVELPLVENRYTIDAELFCEKCFNTKMAIIRYQKRQEKLAQQRRAKTKPTNPNTIVIRPSNDMAEGEMIRINKSVPPPQPEKPHKEENSTPPDNTILEAVFIIEEEK